MLWALLLIIVGGILLLDNFLLLGDFNATALLPLILVVIGAQILLRGDINIDEEVRRFGITRGSVESATLEVSSGEIDVEIRALPEDLRLRDNQFALTAGQFAANSRPALQIDQTYAHLKMLRKKTSLFSMADWRVGVANDLPWQVLVSASLGQVTLDLSQMIIHDGLIATGFGDIQLTAPPEAFGTIHLRSTLGNIHVVTPEGYNVTITVQAGHFFGVNVDEMRYEMDESGIYLAKDVDPNAPRVNILVSGTFGDAYLA